jgi:GntR family transcriptional regulator / MocR family aminotransferase
MPVWSGCMAKRQTTSPTDALAKAGVDLHLELHGPRLRAGLSEALREAVRSGRLAPGTRLPASRALADDLGIARSTVTECYTELIEEGWLTARHGSGTRVAERVQSRRGLVESGVPAPRRQPAHGLGPGATEYAEFPRAPWLAAARRAFAAAPHSAFGYGDPLGRVELRTALADYLSRVRGVYAEPRQIVIISGFHHGLAVIARALRAQGSDTVAVEAYGLDIYRAVLGDEEMSIPPLGVDEHGARVEDLADLEEAGAVLLTPAHQFPTGFALSPQRRALVLDWARSTGGVILEDDYDGEFRYDRKPVGALQGLDPGHVVYFGTASKSIAPALRLAWMVVPDHLLPAVAVTKGRVDTVSVLDQLIFAEFVTSGAFDRHVRGRRQNYRRRRDQLIEAVARSAPDVQVLGMAAGLQAVLTLPAGTEAWVLQAAARQGLVVSGLAEFRHPSAEAPLPWRDALVVNFSAVSDSAWPGALRALCNVLP